MPKLVLISIALLLLAVLAIGWWWSGTRSQAASKPTVDVATIDAAAVAPVVTGATPLETTVGTSVEPGATTRRTPGASASPDTTNVRPAGTGTITGVVRARVDSDDTVTSGFVRIDAAPPIPGSRHDAAEEARLFVAAPVVLIDPAGRFAFPRIPFGDWVVSAQPDGFEHRDRRVVLSLESPTVELDFITRPNRPTTLSIALLNEIGKPLLDPPSASNARERLQQELSALVPGANATSLRPLILDTCPPVGKELRKAEKRRLNGFEPDVSQRSDPWATITLPSPRDGCACALLGDIVIAAVPFVAGQERVELRVLERDLVVLQRACEVLVLDAEANRPLPSAIVKFNFALSRQVVVQSDAEGQARAENVLVGSLEIVAELEGYQTGHDELELTVDSHSPLTTIRMWPSRTIHGVVRIPSQVNVPVLVGAVPATEESTAPRAMAQVDRTDGKFTLTGIAREAYLVGVLTSDATPDSNRVKRNEVDGWTWVDLRDSDVDGVTLDITAAMVPELQDWLAGEEAEFIRELMRDKGRGR